MYDESRLKNANGNTNTNTSTVQNTKYSNLFMEILIIFVKYFGI